MQRIQIKNAHVDTHREIESPLAAHLDTQQASDGAGEAVTSHQVARAPVVLTVAVLDRRRDPCLVLDE